MTVTEASEMIEISSPQSLVQLTRQPEIEFELLTPAEDEAEIVASTMSTASVETGVNSGSDSDGLGVIVSSTTEVLKEMSGTSDVPNLNPLSSESSEGTETRIMGLSMEQFIAAAVIVVVVLLLCGCLAWTLVKRKKRKGIAPSPVSDASVSTSRASAGAKCRH